MYLTDLDPESGGRVYFDETETAATITFANVPLYDVSSSPSTFQATLDYTSGQITISYENLYLSGTKTGQASGGLAVGLSNGSGAYTAVDFSEAAGESHDIPVEGFSGAF